MGHCFNAECEDKSNVKDRSCTDVFWLFIFITLCVFMVLIGAFAYVYGDPKRLVHGYDSFGNVCGSNNTEKLGNFPLSGLDVSLKPFVFFLDVAKIKNSLQICVEQCPDAMISNMDDLRAYFNRTGFSLCRYDFNILEKNSDDEYHGLNETLIASSPLGPCPTFPFYKSVPVLNRCIPSNAATSADMLLKNWDVVEQFLSDIYSTWHLITGLCILSLISSLSIVAMFYFCAGTAGYLILSLVSLIALAGTAVLWWAYKEMADNMHAELPFVERSISNQGAFLFYSILATIMTIIIWFLVLFLKQRVSILVTLFKESLDCLHNLPALYALPIISFIQLMIFYGIWISVIVYLASARYPGTEEIRPFSLSDMNATMASGPNETIEIGSPEQFMNISVQSVKTFTRVEFSDGPWVRYMWWLFFIGLVWISEFILACQQMVIAGAVAKWYFGGKKMADKKNSFVFSSVKHLMCYHLGSIALGSILIPVFKLPRLILRFFHVRLSHTIDDKYTIQWTIKNCLCCSYCYEKFIRYINHNSYPVIIMRGIDFCPAASRAWTISASNPHYIDNSVGDLVLFLAKIIVTAITGLAAFLVFKTQSTIHFYAAPIMLACIFAFFIAHCAISLYEIVIDTLYLCICEDKDINKENGLWKHSALTSIRCHSSETYPMNETYNT